MNTLHEMFETPSLLWHWSLVVGVIILGIAEMRRRRRQLADWPGVRRESDAAHAGWRRRLALRAVGLGCLVIAMAGPRGVRTVDDPTPTAFDVVAVLDVSRSMNAEQPSRLDKSIRSLRNLTAERGLPAGSRVALVVFAAEPWLMFPLTTDLAHLGTSLDALAGGEIPSEIRGGSTIVSGTRIGAAVKLAVDALPESTSNRPAIVLLSDGDDPASDDEWRDGLSAAAARGVAVDTVAIGEPGVAATIPRHGEPLMVDGRIVTTRVDRDRLRELANRTGGVPLTLERGDLPLADLLPPRWNERATSPRRLEAATATSAVTRVPWLLAAFLALLGEWSFVWPARRWRRAAAASAACALVAGNFPDAGRRHLERGVEHFAKGDYRGAIDAFDAALPLVDDPGLAAFNRAAAEFRLGDYAAASADYRRALSDSAIPPSRRSRAQFDLGTSLLHLAGTGADDPLAESRLVEAIAAFEGCLRDDIADDLRSDAEHNLAIARRRLASLSKSPPQAGTNPNPETGKGNDPDGETGPNRPTNRTPEGMSTDPKTGTTNDPTGKAPAFGKITVLVDPRAPAGSLAAEARRIAEERRRHFQSRDLGPVRGKDW